MFSRFYHYTYYSGKWCSLDDEFIDWRMPTSCLSSRPPTLPHEGCFLSKTASSISKIVATIYQWLTGDNISQFEQVPKNWICKKIPPYLFIHNVAETNAKTTQRHKTLTVPMLPSDSSATCELMVTTLPVKSVNLHFTLPCIGDLLDGKVWQLKTPPNRCTQTIILAIKRWLGG